MADGHSVARWKELRAAQESNATKRPPKTESEVDVDLLIVAAMSCGRLQLMAKKGLKLQDGRLISWGAYQTEYEKLKLIKARVVIAVGGVPDAVVSTKPQTTRKK